MPDGFARLDCAIGAQLLRLPGREVHLFRQLPLGAQTIEDFAVARPLVEECRLERPDLPVGGVVEGEPLRLVEDRDRGRQSIDHPRIVVLVALHFRLQGRNLGNVAGDAGGTNACARFNRIENSPLAAHDRRCAALPAAAFADRRSPLRGESPDRTARRPCRSPPGRRAHRRHGRRGHCTRRSVPRSRASMRACRPSRARGEVRPARSPQARTDRGAAPIEAARPKRRGCARRRCRTPGCRRVRDSVRAG